MRPSPGDLVAGKYRVVRLIGDGGMGSVFEARHEFLGTAVALKFLHAELAKRPGLVARFLQEARVAATVKSPHIAHVTDVDQIAGGTAYLVMELLEGETLQAVIERERRLPRDLAIDYAVQILAGLEAAHAAGVVHRDLKPDNVFVTRAQGGPLVKLLDFGIAKLRVSREFQQGLTRPGVLMGTPEYMAPEQAFSAAEVDPSADVYAAGVILYECIAGRRPVEADDARAIAEIVRQGGATPLRAIDPAVPEALAQAVHKAMAPLPAGRFASAAEMRAALAPFCGALSAAGRAALGSAGGAGPGAAGGPSAAVSIGETTRRDGSGAIAAMSSAPAVSAASAPPGVSPPAGGRAGTGTLPPDDETPAAVVATGPTGTSFGGTAPMSPLAAHASAFTPGAQAMTPPPRPFTGVGPVHTPRRRRPVPLGLIAALAGVAAGLGLIAFLSATRTRTEDGPDPTIRVGATAATAVPADTRTAGGTTPTATVPPPTVPPPTATTAKPPATGTAPAAKDAGAKDAGGAWPWASQIPPLPSALPPMPTTFPPLPFPFPVATGSGKAN